MSNTISGKNIKIVFSNELPKGGEGIIIHYEHDPVSLNGWETCDIRTVVAENEDKWLSQIESWHRDVSEKSMKLTPWWWLYQGSRLILWETVTSFSLKPILFAQALIQICTLNPQKDIWVIAAKDEFVSHVTEWAIKHKEINIVNNSQNKKYNILSHLILEKVFFSVKVLKNIFLYFFLILIQRKRTVSPTNVIIHSSIINISLLDTVGDHYFGSMFDEYADGRKRKDITWLYNDLRINKNSADLKLHRIGRHAYFNTDLFKFSDLLFAIYHGAIAHRAIRKIKKKCNPLIIDEQCFPEFSKYFVKNLVLLNVPIYELMTYKQFLRVLRISKPKKLVYPYEEKTIERAILQAVQDSKLPIKTIAFAHAAYSKGHMYIKRAKIGDPPRPDIIAVSGEAYKNRFIKAGVPQEQVVITGSPRCYQNISTIETKQKRYNKILLICGLGFELRIFAAYLENNKAILDGYELSIRRCPHSWMKEQDDAEKRLKAAGINYTCENGNLIEEISNSDIVLFESTSAGMEAVFNGKVVIRLNLYDMIPTEHFSEQADNNKIKYCKSLEELKLELDKIISLSQEQYMKKNLSQRELVNHLYSPVDPIAVNNVIV